MAKETVTHRCTLCFSKAETPDAGEFIWKDSMQLCPKCYERYSESAYNQRVMLINSVKSYRRLIIQYEESSNVKFDTNFNL